MKTLSGKLKYVVLAAIVVLAIFTLRAFAAPPCPPDPGPDKAVFILKMIKPVTAKDQDHFKDVLAGLGTKLYCIHVAHNNGKPDEDIVSPNQTKLDIKTDKVMTSETPKSAEGEELTPIGVHVTQLVSSPSKADILTVLNALQ